MAAKTLADHIIRQVKEGGPDNALAGLGRYPKFQYGQYVVYLAYLAFFAVEHFRLMVPELACEDERFEFAVFMLVDGGNFDECTVHDMFAYVRDHAPVDQDGDIVKIDQIDTVADEDRPHLLLRATALEDAWRIYETFERGDKRARFDDYDIEPLAELVDMQVIPDDGP